MCDVKHLIEWCEEIIKRHELNETEKNRTEHRQHTLTTAALVLSPLVA